MMTTESVKKMSGSKPVWQTGPSPLWQTGSKPLWLPLLLLVMMLSTTVHAKFKPLYTYYNFSFGARSMGMGNAFTAVADDLTAVFWNPAGISQFQYPQALVNYRNDKMLYKYDVQENTASTSLQTYNSTFDSTIKQFDFVSVSVPAYFWDMKWNFALSYYRLLPYTMSGRNVDSVVTTTSANYSSDQKITQSFTGENGIDVLAFTGAYHFSDYFALGLTVQQYLNSGTVNYRYVSDTQQYTQTYTDKFQGRNFILGFTFKPIKDVVIGLAYRTRLHNKFSSDSILDVDGSQSSTTSSTTSDTVLPARLSMGLQVRLFKFMRFSYDYSTIYWSLGTISNYYGNTEDLPYPVRADYTFDQKDAKNNRLGVEFNINLRNTVLFFRSGVYSEIPLFVDHQDATLKITGYSLGAGIRLFSTVDLDFAFMKQKGDWTELGYFDTTTPVYTHYTNKIISLSL
ncbi:MAG: hypothetical protein GY757_37650, partial [bacterium]|nr:hypothetical protein [bacterium]